MKEGNESAELKNEIHYNKIIYIQLRLFSKTVVKVYVLCPYLRHTSQEEGNESLQKQKKSIISLFQIKKNHKNHKIKKKSQK